MLFSFAAITIPPWCIHTLALLNPSRARSINKCLCSIGDQWNVRYILKETSGELIGARKFCNWSIQDRTLVDPSRELVKMRCFVRYLPPSLPWHQHGRTSMQSKSSDPLFRLVYPILVSQSTALIHAQQEWCEAAATLRLTHWLALFVHSSVLRSKGRKVESWMASWDWDSRCSDKMIFMQNYFKFEVVFRQLAF